MKTEGLCQELLVGGAGTVTSYCHLSIPAAFRTEMGAQFVFVFFKFCFVFMYQSLGAEVFSFVVSPIFDFFGDTVIVVAK